jgi:uncharacterized protein involved in response to NO
MDIPRYRPYEGPILLSAGFRPFFLLAALWAALAIPLWLLTFAGENMVSSVLPATDWHAHEMVFGYGAAVVAGFLLTAIPNWTGRMPLQGGPLGGLILLWLTGRAFVLFSASSGATFATVFDLAFPLVFLGVVTREILAGRNWRNLPMLVALSLLLLGNCLVHAEAVGIASTAALGNRLGVATLLMLISLVGGRIIPSFTRNWLVRQNPDAATPAAFDRLDHAVLAITGLALATWVLAPNAPLAPWMEFAAGLALCVRLARWRGAATLHEPLLWVLHLGYGWLALGFLLLGLNGIAPLLPESTALHALTVGAIGTMTVAVMTRATLGHTGRPLVAGTGTTTIYVLVTLATILRLLAPLGGSQYMHILFVAGGAWSGAFGLFVLLYMRPLTLPPVKGEYARPI